MTICNIQNNYSEYEEEKKNSWVELNAVQEIIVSLLTKKIVVEIGTMNNSSKHL